MSTAAGSAGDHALAARECLAAAWRAPDADKPPGTRAASRPDADSSPPRDDRVDGTGGRGVVRAARARAARDQGAAERWLPGRSDPDRGPDQPESRAAIAGGREWLADRSRSGGRRRAAWRGGL